MCLKQKIYVIIPLFLCYYLFSQNKFNSNSSLTNSFLTSNKTNEISNDGSVDISIPIGSVEIQNYVLNVSLKNRSTGIKINDDSDMFGTNWNISSVGMITREINKYPDDIKDIVINSSNLGGCIKLGQLTNVGYFYNREKIKQFLTTYDSNYPNVPLSVNTNITTNSLDSPYFTPPRMFTIPDDTSMSRDYEPDIFTVIIPGHRSFKFFFDLDKNIIITPDDNYKITYIESSEGLESFTVADKNGTIFKFRTKETRRISNTASEVTSCIGCVVGEDVVQNVSILPTELCSNISDELKNNFKKFYTKSWYLDEINNIYNEKISFTYENKELYKITPPYGIRPYSSDYAIGNENSFNEMNWSTDIFGNMTYQQKTFDKFKQGVEAINTPIINSIFTNNKVISFNFGDLRKDICKNSLSQYKEVKSIDIWSYSGTTISYPHNFISNNYKKIKSFELNYIYSNRWFNLENIDSSITYAGKRLFLNNVTEVINNIPGIRYSIEYYGNLNNLPHKQTYERDYWNYYKESASKYGIFPIYYYYPDEGKNNIDLGKFSIYPRLNYTGVQKSILDYYPNVPLKSYYFTDKTPDLQNTIIGAVKTIYTSLGGQINYQYEPNYFNYYNIKRPSGGLRIKSTETINNQDKYITEFYYGKNGDGIGYNYFNTGLVSLCYDQPSLPSVNNVEYQSLNKFDFGNKLLKFKFLEEASSNTLYEEIKSVSKDGSGNIKDTKVTKYSSFKDDDQRNGFQLGNVFYKSDIYSSYSLIFQKFNNSSYSTAFYTKNLLDYHPFLEKEDFASINGFPLNEKFFNSNGDLIKENNYSYNLNVKEYKYIHDDNNGYHPSESLYKIRKYEYFLNELISKDFINSNNILTSKHNYFRNALNQENKEINLLSDNNIITTSKKYCHEEYGSLFLTNNRLNEVCEINQVSNNKTISIKNIYSDFSIPYLPEPNTTGGANSGYLNKLQYLSHHSEKALDGATYFEQDEKVNLRTLQGLPLEVENKNRVKTILYGYSNSLPIAEIEGATYNQVMQIFNLDPKSTASFTNLDIVQKSNLDIDNSSEQSLINALETFRKKTEFKDYQITTYTYNPLIGVTSITSPNGMKEFYKYNVQNKLEKILDADGNILKEYQYNYQTPYYNVAKNQTFTRNNCGSGYIGGSYTYTVPAGKYSSMISQADADAQAQTDINSNGQNMTNANGVCIGSNCSVSFNSSAGINGGGGTSYVNNNYRLSFGFSSGSNSTNLPWTTTGVKIATVNGNCRPKADYTSYNGQVYYTIKINGDVILRTTSILPNNTSYNYDLYFPIN